MISSLRSGKTKRNVIYSTYIQRLLYIMSSFLPISKDSMITRPETSIAPENRPSQKETSLAMIHFQGLC